jgi:hypothetical protein
MILLLTILFYNIILFTYVIQIIIKCSPLNKIILLLPFNIIKSLNNRVQYFLNSITILLTYCRSLWNNKIKSIEDDSFSHLIALTILYV